jgi:hypothetical protein
MAVNRWTRSFFIGLVVNAIAASLTAAPHTARGGDLKLLQQILALLPEGTRPTVPVRFVDPREMGKTSDPGAFTLAGDPTIYVSTETVAFALARAGDRHAQAVLATCIWHEEQHIRGRGEAEAYDAQIEVVTMFVRTGRMNRARGEALVQTLRDIRAGLNAQIASVRR